MIRILLLSILIFTSSYGRANTIQVDTVKIYCGESRECSSIKENFSSLKRTFIDIDHLNTILKLYTLNSGIKYFNYQLIKKNEKILLEIRLEPKKKVTSIEVRPTNLDLPSILPIKEDDYLDNNKITKTKELLKELYQNKGYPQVKVKHKVEETLANGLNLRFDVVLGDPIIVKEIEVNTKSEFIRDIIRRKLSLFSGKPFTIQETKTAMEELRILLNGYGYYLIELNLKYTLKNKNVALFVEVLNHTKHVFDVRVNGVGLDHLDFKELLKESVLSYKRKLGKDLLEQIIDEKTKEKGYLFSKISIEQKEYLNLQKDSVFFNKIEITLSDKSYLDSIEFKGLSIFESSYFKKLFYENAPSQVLSGVYSKKYYLGFMQIIREEYIKKGYVNVFLEEPIIQIKEKSKNIILTYRVREGLRADVEKLKIYGVPVDLKEKIVSLMKTKETFAFNPIDFKEDIITIKRYLQNHGYFYAEIINESTGSLVKYNDDNSKVSLSFDFKLDKKYIINEVIIVGNHKTRSKVIRRELIFKKNDLVTLKDMSNSQTNLLSLGLFNSVVITPVRNKTNKADMLISLKEKEFGLIEIAPGIRTDLGPKLSTSISYNNIDGLHKQISFQGQVNQRFNLNSLDERRREESNSLVEYLGIVNYTENHLFDSDWNLGVALSKSRKRFFAFDADIQKFRYTMSKDFTRWFNFSITQQLETISQYDATVEREKGHFQIGSISPSVTFDFRNNRINPTKGTFFNLSWEMANPTFFSQDNDELVINYYKIISRNRFYIPFSNGTVAISLAGGVQKNLATGKKTDESGNTYSEGYIPNIKVFRLSGMDIVRGFEDDEINRLISGDDISGVEVDDKAYMANIKVEPRFFLNDSMMLGVFYDAGRVFVDSYHLDQLRSSVGLSFKYLTPVGSLDFDYGIKLLRKRDSDGILESPGRLHVSIGFF